MASGPHPSERPASPPASPARQENSHPWLYCAYGRQHPLRIWHQRRRTSFQQLLGQREQRGIKTRIAFRAEQQVKGCLSESVPYVHVGGISKQLESHLEIIALDCIVQRRVLLGIAPLGIWLCAELQQHFHGLGPVGTPEKVRARRCQLQWKLTTSFKAEALRIWFCPAVQQHTQSRQVCLAHALMQGMLCRTAVPPLQCRLQAWNRVILDRSVDIVLHFLSLLSRARAHRGTDVYDL